MLPVASMKEVPSHFSPTSFRTTPVHPNALISMKIIQLFSSVRSWDKRRKLTILYNNKPAADQWGLDIHVSKTITVFLLHTMWTQRKLWRKSLRRSASAICSIASLWLGSGQYAGRGSDSPAEIALCRYSYVLRRYEYNGYPQWTSGAGAVAYPLY
jgi:hypothetical protein